MFGRLSTIVVPALCVALLAGCSSSSKKSSSSRPGGGGESAEGSVNDRRVQRHLAELHSSDPRVRIDAADRIGALPPGPHLAQAVPDLVAALADRHLGVRHRAAAALGAIADRRALAALQAALRDPNNNDEIRTVVAAALGRIPDPDSIALLSPPLKDPNANSALRLAAIEAIALIDAPARVEALTPAINDNDTEIRQAAILALGRTKAAAAVEPLIAVLSDKDARVVESAVWSLAEIADKRSFDAIAKLLDSPVTRLRWAAAGGLGKLGDARGVAPLARLIRQDEAKRVAGAAAKDAEDPAVIAAAAFSLAKLGDPASLDAVGVALKHTDLAVRQNAAQALGLVKHERAVALLIDLLGSNDSSYSVRQMTAISLGKIGKDLSLSPVLKMLESAELAQRRAGAFVFSFALKCPEAVEPLIRLLADKDSQVRESAVRALGEIGDRRAVAPLLPLLDANDTYSLELGAEALGKLKDSRAVPPLCRIAAATDLRGRCRPAAVQALGLIGDRAATDVLMGLLKGTDNILKETTIRAIGQIGDANAVPALVELLTSTKPTYERRPMVAHRYVNSNDILSATMDALGKIGDPRAIAPLQQVKQTGHPEIIPLADAALGKIRSPSPAK